MIRIKWIYGLFLCFIMQSNLYTQIITHGPIIGAVTDSSAEIVFFTDQYTIGNIHLSVSEDFNYILSFPFETDANNVVKTRLSKLSDNTRFYFKISVHDDMEISMFKGSFITFPANKDTSRFSFTLGSCTEQHYNDSVFVEMQKQKPAFFLHLGDWLYTNNFNEKKFYYTESVEHQKELYQKRYEMPNLKSFLQTTPIDFVFDDEDGVYDDFSKTSYTVLKRNGNLTEFNEVTYPDSLRKMAIKGLHTFFPAYKEVNDQAYHSFVFGNTEIFFLDTRSTRSPNTEVFHKNGDYYKYKVPANHHILDTAQLNWLLTKLRNSKAHWKFIVSGVTFNKSYKKIIDIAMLKRIQNRKLSNKMTGTYISASLASMWFAFPETQSALINFCRDNAIKNVIILSGDAHTAAIDDGANAGFPELMAGGLAQKNSRLAAIIKNNLQLNLWNQGGQGINNSNFNDAFGNVTVNSNDSVTLSCMDKYGNLICSYEVNDGFLPQYYAYKKNKSITLGNKIKAAKQALKIRRTL
jgi:alkaline phosphatase D